MNKQPPIEKIYEAYSAIADGRVIMRDEGATVVSSSRAKEYAVTWNGKIYSSNDNATYWQGYAGYPIIAVLMLQGRLPLNWRIAAIFSGINWMEANTAAKNDYAKAVETVFHQLLCGAEKQNEARLEAEKVHEALKTLDIEVKRSSRRKN